MTTRIRAAVVEKLGAPFDLQDLDLDAPGEGELLVRVVASGVCHTDEITRHGDLPMPFPGVLGHEGSGVVEQMGAGVTDIAVGDHVIVGWPFCGTCDHCLRGEPRYCLRLGEALCGGARLLGPQAGLSAYHRLDGSSLHGHFFGQSSFATHTVCRADSVVKVDADLPIELFGPLACGLTTGAGAIFTTARPEPGQSIVVFGVGAVGLAAVMAAKLSPATTIVAVDRHASRLALASELGATHTVNADETDSLAAIREICGGPADVALECTGVIPVVETAIDAVGMLGTCILIGGAPAQARFSADHLGALWGKRIIGTLGGGSTSRRLIGALVELYRQGRFPFDRLVTFYELDQIDQALRDSASGAVVKAIVRTTSSSQGAS